jgi:hypothetical protein
MIGEQDPSKDRNVPAEFAPSAKKVFGASRTFAAVTNGEGSTLSIVREHGETTLAKLRVEDTDGVIVEVSLNRNNRRRVRALMDMMDICDGE